MHLVRRFFGSLRPGGPSPPEVAWVRSQLLPGEWDLWQSMPGPDRRHSAGVARRVERSLGPQATRAVLAAALLHDVGKSGARLRTPGRVVATIAGAGSRRARVASGDGRIARYLRHDSDGASMLEDAGSDELTIAWTREHHLPEARWTVPVAVGRVLRDADDD